MRMPSAVRASGRQMRCCFAQGVLRGRSCAVVTSDRLVRRNDNRACVAVNINRLLTPRYWASISTPTVGMMMLNERARITVCECAAAFNSRPLRRFYQFEELAWRQLFRHAQIDGRVSWPGAGKRCSP